MDKCVNNDPFINDSIQIHPNYHFAIIRIRMTIPSCLVIDIVKTGIITSSQSYVSYIKIIKESNGKRVVNVNNILITKIINICLI